MGQYFLACSPSAEEYVELPGAMKAIERVTNGVAMGMLGYLVLEGPNDGTALTRNAHTDTEEIRAKVEEIREREREHEEKNLTRYLEERPDYITNRFERHYDATPDEAPEEFREYCEDEALGTYRNEDGSWDEDDLIRIALSHLEIKDSHDYAGRWGGERVAITGDYSEREWYDKTRRHTVVDLPTGEQVRVRGIRELTNPDGSKAYSTPISVDEIPHADEPGDHLEVSAVHHSGDEREVGTVVRIEEPEYTDITDGVIKEFVSFVGDDWYSDNIGRGKLRPDAVITSD